MIGINEKENDDSINKEDMLLDDDIQEDTLTNVNLKNTENDNANDEDEDKANTASEEVDENSEEFETDLVDIDGEERGGKKKEEDDSDEIGEDSMAKLAALNAKLMRDNGIDIEPENIKTFDDLVSSIKKFKKSEREEYVNGLPEDIRVMAEAYHRGEDPNKYREIYNKVSDVSKINDEDFESNEDLAVKIIKEDLRNRGFNTNEIEEEIELYKDQDVISKRAKRSKNSLLKFRESEINSLQESEKERKRRIEQSQKEWENGISSYMDKAEELFNNPFDEDDKKELEKFMYEPVEERNGVPVTKLQKAIEDDPSILVQMNYLLKVGALGKDADFDKIGLKKRANIAREMERALKSDSFKGASRKSNKEEAKVVDGLKPLGDVLSGLGNF